MEQERRGGDVDANELPDVVHDRRLKYESASGGAPFTEVRFKNLKRRGKLSARG